MKEMDNSVRLALGLSVITIASIIIILGAIYLIQNQDWPIVQNNDISNWVTLTVGIGVGVVIATIIYLITYIQQKELKKISEKRVRVNNWFFKTHLKTMKSNFEDLVRVKDFQEKEIRDVNVKMRIKFLNDDNEKIITMLQIFSDDIDADLIPQLISFNSVLKNYLEHASDDSFSSTQETGISSYFDRILNIIPDVKRQDK